MSNAVFSHLHTYGCDQGTSSRQALLPGAELVGYSGAGCEGCAPLSDPQVLSVPDDDLQLGVLHGVAECDGESSF